MCPKVPRCVKTSLITSKQLVIKSVKTCPMVSKCIQRCLDVSRYCLSTPNTKCSEACRSVSRGVKLCQDITSHV